MLKSCDALVESVLNLYGEQPEGIFDFVNGIKMMEEEGFLEHDFCAEPKHVAVAA